jgi:hypothetical protein
MQLLECPHCHQPGFSVLRKMFLGPATWAKCRNCGGAVSVPWSAMWATTPFIAAILVTRWVSLPTAVVLLIGGAAVMTFVHYRFVPLIAK